MNKYSKQVLLNMFLLDASNIILERREEKKREAKGKGQRNYKIDFEQNKVGGKIKGGMGGGVLFFSMVALKCSMTSSKNLLEM